MTTKPTRAEKNRIIINESKGIQHPLYYVHTTKSGLVQVRKRTTPLPTESASKIVGDEGTASSSLKGDEPQPKPQIDYETVTNKQLLEKMLQILEQNVVSRDRNLNSVENERVTAENEKFITEVEQAKPSSLIEVEHRPARRGRTL